MRFGFVLMVWFVLYCAFMVLNPLGADASGLCEYSKGKEVIARYQMDIAEASYQRAVEEDNWLVNDVSARQISLRLATERWKDASAVIKDHCP
jgi:hypothetical protein